MGYRHGAHTVFGIHLHLVWTTKYRKPVVSGEVGLRVREVIRRVCQRLKGKSSHTLLNEYSHLRRAYWGRHLWARGYFCCSSGNVTDEVITQYIENQHHEEDADFRVEGEDGPTRPPKPSA